MPNAAVHYAKGSAGHVDDDIVLLVKQGLRNQLNMEADEVDASVLSNVGADEFHIGGAPATLHVLEKLGIRDGDRVMDFGSGLGGPARQVAIRFPRCTVVGVDITPKFVRAGQAINQFGAIAAQLGGRVSFFDGDCSSLDPATFPDASVDKAFSIHVAMNIRDKTAMAREVSRVLKPGGHFVVFDQMANPAPPATPRTWMSMLCGERGDRGEDGSSDINDTLPYPLPWACSKDDSFCESPDVYVAAFETAGMSLVGKEDRSADMLAVFSQMQRNMLYHFVTNMTTTPPVLGPQILMGSDLTTKVGNYKTAVANGQLVLTELVFKKTG